MSSSLSAKGAAHVDEVLGALNRHPSQMEISIGEKCNLACDYCFVDKSGTAVARWEEIRRAIDVFYGFPASSKTVTFTTMEPFLHARTWMKSVEHLLSRADAKNIPLERIITTTNGILMDQDVRRFIARTDERLWINLSIDGRPGSHDRHRPTAGASPRGSFDLAWKNFDALPRERVRVIWTVSPDQVADFADNARFFLDSGFIHIDVFPDILTVWKPADLDRLEAALKDLIAEVNAANGRRNLRLLNRLWGLPYNDKILFGSDERFYLYEGVLLIPYAERSGFIVGDSRRGVDLDARRALFKRLFAATGRAARFECADCEFKNVCALPTPLYLWCRSRRKDFKTHFDSFNRVAKTFIRLSRTVQPYGRNWTDTARLTASSRVHGR